MQKSKGAAEALTAVIMTGVLIGVVGSVYLWGLPLIQKNKDIASLHAAESFMVDLSNKIKDVVNSAGRQRIAVSAPGILNFDGSKFQFTVKTDGTIYSTEGQIPLGRNGCSPDTGVFGVQDSATLCVSSTKIGDKFETVYTLKFIQLDTEGVDSRKIVFSGRPNAGGETRVITLDNTGTTKEPSGSKIITKANIAVDIGV